MLSKLTNFSNAFSRWGDLVLAFLVVAIIGLLIIPLPTPVVDLLISVNLLGALMLCFIGLIPGFPKLQIFGLFQELSPEINIQPLGRLKI